MSGQLERAIAAAIGEGILPSGTVAPGDSGRPWPVVLLTALGAWLAAVPILVSLVMLVGEAAFRGATAYLIGVIALAGAIALLRIKTLPLFMEQLAVPGLLTGGLALGYALFRDLPGDTGAAAMAAMALGVAFLVPQAWLRSVLGATACALTVLAIAPGWHRQIPETTLFSLLAVTGFWLLMQSMPALGAPADGWVLGTLAGLAFWSGMTFLAGASIAPFGGQSGGGALGYSAAAQLGSMALAAAAAAWLARNWRSLRKGWCGAAAAVVIGLAWLMPSLGAVLLILAVCATRGRWALAASAGVAAAWIIGAFYYQLALPLTTKAAIMVAAGAVLGALAWTALRGTALKPAGSPARADAPRARLAIAACALAVLAVANVGIWQKEALIANGKPVFVELAPVDPRSLMQGDYMRLAFRLPRFNGDHSAQMKTTRRPRAIGKIDARGIALLDRFDIGDGPGPGEIAVELKHANNGWTVVTDAWYFEEGDADRWVRAKYGEFRVDANGRALLVGLRGPALEPL